LDVRVGLAKKPLKGAVSARRKSDAILYTDPDSVTFCSMGAKVKPSESGPLNLFTRGLLNFAK
jgi:hypothetical protein